MKLGASVIVGLVGGFLFGFAWGQATRSQLPAATSTSYAGGNLTVTVNAKQALENGLASLLQ